MGTYRAIQDLVKSNYGFWPKTCWIAHVKELCGLPLRKAPNRADQGVRKYECPLDKRGPIINSMIRLGLMEPNEEQVSKHARWLTAIHEAGHAIVHMKLGGQVNYLFIGPSGPVYEGGANVETFDLDTSEGRYKEMMTVLSGELALTVMQIPREIRHDIAGNGDWSRANALGREDCLDKDGFTDDAKLEELQDQAYRQAYEILEKNRPLVVKVAKLLLSQKDGELITPPWNKP